MDPEEQGPPPCPRVYPSNLESRVQIAKKAFEDGYFSHITAAAKAYSVPYFTLQGKIRSHKPISQNKGVSGRILTKEMEGALDAYIARRIAFGSSTFSSYSF